MNQKNNGGPAFPVPGLQHDEDFNGMTLRDHFAGQALQGYLASYDATSEPAEFATAIAMDCYKIADAMLVARSAA